jgi:murein DD-endopeptidase MepM/ murein hydrolase activator NlpD
MNHSFRILFAFLLTAPLVCGFNCSLNLDYQALFKANPSYCSDGFDFPVGPPNAKNYYNAQPFGKNYHLGDDWNGTGGGNTDLGDPIYSIGNGYVSAIENHGAGWGNVIRIVHFIKDKNLLVESLYAHCNEMLIEPNTWVKRGQKIGTIGNAEGAYWAHLHLEIRTEVDMDLGGGYSEETDGYTDPTAFIKLNRPKKE